MAENNLEILVDADSCPVKSEIYKVAIRHQTRVVLVSNSYIKIPDNPLFELKIVSNDFDAADDYIAEHSSDFSIVITSDILLADRCLKTNSKVIGPNGILFTNDSIGTAVATRALMEDLRAGGEQHGGPAAFTKTDRSRFLSSLHEALLRKR